MKEKSDFSPASSVNLLFAKPVVYESPVPRKTIVLVSKKDDSGCSFISSSCVEDEMKSIIQLNFQEQLLSTLVDKGIDPKSLNMIDVNKLGCDLGVEQLANHIISHVDDYIVKSQTSEK